MYDTYDTNVCDDFPDPNCYEEVDRYEGDNAESLFDQLYESSNAVLDDDEEDPETIGNWSVVKDFDCNIGINTIDSICLEQARKEVPVVLSRIMNLHDSSIKPDDRLNHITSLQQIDFFRVWMGMTGMNGTIGLQPFFQTLQQWVQQYFNQPNQLAVLAALKENPNVTCDDILLFIEAELLICFYKCSPSQYFNETFGDRYPSAKEGISFCRYKLILQALSTSDHIEEEIDPNEWCAPYECDKKMARVVECFRKLCSCIAFVRGIIRLYC